MKEKTDKLVTWVALGIAILASIFAIVFAMNTANEGMFNVAYWIVFLFVLLAVLGMLGFFVLRFVKNFKENPAKARKTLIVIGIAIVVCILAFLLASGNDVSKAIQMDWYCLHRGLYLGVWCYRRHYLCRVCKNV